MHVWRINRRVYSPLSGEGARRSSTNRWNRAGTSLIYTSAHLSLCVLEMLVHLDFDELPDDYAAFQIEIPDGIEIERMEPSDLPPSWQSDLSATQAIGERWVQSAASPVMRVPSAILEQEYHFILNPGQDDFQRIRILAEHAFSFDTRLPGFRTSI